MDKCICSVCGTENEMHYQYCKNCGAKLQKPADNESYANYSGQSDNFYANRGYSQSNQYSNQNNNFFNGTYGITEIDGVKTEDLAAYIGPKNKRIINKFIKMHLSNSKVSFCWPAALWGLLGPIGVGIWFIYRKMYKFGIILLAIGIILSGALTAIGGKDPDASENFSVEYFGLIAEDSDYGQLEEIPEIEEGKNPDTLRMRISYLLDDIIGLASCVLAGLFSMYAYKKHAIEKIKQYNIINASERYRQIGLMAVGGTSAGMAVLAFFVALFMSMIIDKILFLFI